MAPRTPPGSTANTTLTVHDTTNMAMATTLARRGMPSPAR